MMKLIIFTLFAALIFLFVWQTAEVYQNRIIAQLGTAKDQDIQLLVDQANFYVENMKQSIYRTNKFSVCNGTTQTTIECDTSLIECDTPKITETPCTTPSMSL